MYHKGLICRPSTCAIIGGVLTIASLVDSLIFSSSKRLQANNDGFGAPGGKMVSLTHSEKAEMPHADGLSDVRWSL